MYSRENFLSLRILFYYFLEDSIYQPKKNEIEYFGGQNQNEHQSPAEREFFISPAVIRDYLRNSIIIFHNNVNGCYLQSR